MPLEEEIVREKNPGLLRERAGERNEIGIVAGTDFPMDLKK
jgi:hypothetical protein